MKQSIILWVSAAIITFLIGFIQNRISGTYPTSGTIGIDAQKVSYHLKKIHRDKNNYDIIIRTDIKDLKGIVKWRRVNENQIWNSDTLKYLDGILKITIPKQDPMNEIEYKITLSHNQEEYFIPSNSYEKILFVGSAPLSIIIHYYLTLFAGILLAVRAGLEFFSSKPRLRLYSIFTLISFFACAMIFAPVQKAYERGAIGIYVPGVGKIFQVWLVMLVLIWIMNLILISYTKHHKSCVLISTMLTVIIFLSQNFI